MLKVKIATDNLPVVTGVECAISDAKKGSSLGVVGVFTITLQEGEGRQKVTLLQEVGCIWQSQLLLVLFFEDGKVRLERRVD